ncbi:LEPR-XLL domain-containing protein [Ramlibacter sp. G-1-2-2]|uniref:LEPR-XLL domain-containing protein n=1 Tax=Ramlibacter agri TaxID=2728837 RepID=A0A848HH47_9BURK|nr:LEPR-XLL domain-containing protein [Ramlibacter agri]NML47853.1 LEPR-XLL domain-containing protein [Ramlibacter agri]
MKPVQPPFKRALRDLFRVEPLEARVLLSADPVLGAVAVALKPADQDPAAAVAQAYAAPADVNVATTPGATVLVADNAQQPADATSQWLLVDTAQLADANGRVVVGGPDSNAVIHVGTSQVGDLVLMNPQAGGEVYLDGALQLTGSLMILGSGHTTTVSADISDANDVTIADSVKINGNRTIEAGTDGTGFVQLGNNTASTINGDGVGAADSLVVHAADNVRFTGPVGGTDPLTSLTIDGVNVGGTPNLPNNVNFDRDVTVNGDLVINATGTVTFTGMVTLNNGGSLRITGASSVVFQSGLVLVKDTTTGRVGNIFIEGNEIDFVGGSESVKGDGMLTLRPSNVGYGIDVGTIPNSASQPANTTLNLDSADLKALADGFSKIVIGQQDGLHANVAAGNVRIGAESQNVLLRDPVEVYGGTIAVTDMQPSDYQLSVDGSITLDAYGDITIANRMEANLGGSTLTDVTLYSATGKVAQVNDLGDNVGAEPLRAGALTVHAAGGISLPYTEITSVSATNTASGDLSITETATGADVIVTLLSQQAASGGIALNTTAGSITVNGGITNAGSGLTQLGAAGSGKNITVNQDIHSASGTIQLTAAGAITTNDDAGSVTHGVIATDGAGNVQLVASSGAIQQGADILSAGGLVSLDAFTTVTMSDGVKAQSLGLGAGSVSLKARGGNVTVSIVNADGTISIAAAAAIIDGLTGSNPNLDGETAAVLLAAASGIGTGSTPLQTRVNALAATNTTTGGVFIREATALRISGGAGSYAVDAGGSDGSVSITTIDGAITIEKGVRSTGTVGNMLVQTSEAAEATVADLKIRADVTTAHGSMSLLSADSINVDDLVAATAPTISVTGSGQTLDVSADAAITTEGNARFATAGGALRLYADAGDVSLGVADAGAGNVSISAMHGGRILDAQADDGNATPSANVIAGSVRLQGDAGIGLAGALFDTQVATLAAKVTTGSVFLAERDALSVGDVAALSVNRITAQATLGAPVSDTSLSGIGGNAGVVLQAGGNLAIDRAVGAGGNLLLSSGGTLAVNAIASTSAGNLSALANGTLTVAATGVLDATAGVDIESTTGAVNMVDGAVARSNAATIRVKAATGVTVGLLDARSSSDRAGGTTNDFATWGAVSVVAGGNIADNTGETATDIYGYTVRLQAGGGIGASGEQLETEAGQMSAKAGAAGLFLADATGLEVLAQGDIGVARVGLDGVAAIGPVDAAQSGLASGGVLAVVAQGGPLVVDTGTAVTAAGNVLLTALTSDVALSSDVSSGGNISIESARDLLVAGNIAATAAGKTVDLSATRTLSQAQGTTISSNNGNVSLDAGGAVTIETLNAGTGGVFVSGLTIADGDAAGDTEVDIIGGAAQLKGSNGIGAAGAALETQVTTLSAIGNGVFLTESDGVTVDRVQVDVNRVDANGGVAAAGHAAQEDVSGTTVVLATLAGDLTLNAGTAATDAVYGGPGNVRLEAVAGHVVANGNITSSNGSLSVLGASGVAFQGTAGIVAYSGTVDIAASNGAITMADGTGVLTDGGAIRLQASGDITVANLNATATGSVSVNAGGNIADNTGNTNIDILAGVLRLQAGGGIGAADNALETWVGQLSASAGAAGMFLLESDAVLVTQTAAISVNRVGLDGTTLTAQADGVQAGLASGGAVSLQTTNGTLTTDAQGAVSAGGNLYLGAGGSSSDLVTGAAVSSSGGSLSLAAGRDALLGGSVSATAAGSSVEVKAARDVLQAQGTAITTSNGGIVVTGGSLATNGIAGTVTLETLNAGTAGVQVGAQSIVDGDAAGDTEVDIVAGSAALFAGAGIGAAGAALETAVGTLKVGAVGDVFVTESDAVVIDAVSVSYQRVDASGATTNVTTGSLAGLSGANLVLRTLAGSITSAAGVAVAATGNLLLQAGGSTSDIALAGSASAGGAMSLIAGRDATVKSTVTTTGGSIDIQSGGRIDAQQGSAIASGNGNVQLLALSGSVTLELVNAGTGTVRISGSSIIDGDTTTGETEVDIVADKLLLTATSSAGTGVNPLETTVNTLSVSAGSTVGIVESDGLVLDTVTASVNRVAVDGTTAATTPVTQGNVGGSTVTLRTLAGSLSATAAGGKVTATGNLLLKAGGATSDMTLGAAVSTTTGNISLDAGRDMSLAAALSTAGAGKTIDLLAGGALTQQQGSTLTTTNGHASLVAGGVLTIETISVGIGRVNISGSSIVDGDAAGDTEVDILAAGVRATATAGGIGSSGNALETTISTLSAVATGDVFITETDALDLAVVSATVNRVGNNGADAVVTSGGQNNVSGATVVVRTLGGNLTNQATGVVSATGNLLLSAGGAASDLNLAAAVSSSGGDVSLAAGEDIILGANVTSTAPGKSIDLVAGRNFTQAQGTTLQTNAGNIGLQAGGVATLETFNAFSGYVRIQAGSVVDGDTTANESEVDVSAFGLQLVTTGAVGASANALETTVQTLAASAGGNLFLANTGALNISALAIDTQRVGTDGVSTSTTNAATSGLSTATAVVQSGGILESIASAAINASGNLLLKTLDGADMNLQGSVSASGDLTLDSGRDLLLGGAVATTGAGRTLVLLANRAFTQAQGSSASSSDGTIVVSAVLEATVESLAAGTGTVRINASRVIDGDADGDNEVDVTAGALGIVASNGAIGTAANALETAVGSIALGAAQGDVFVTESDALTVDTVGGTAQRVGSDGASQALALASLAGLNGNQVVVRTLAGSLATTAGGGLVMAGSNLLLSAGGAGSDLSLGAAVASTGGDISLLAGRDLLLNASVSTTGSGNTIDLSAQRNLAQAQGTAVTSTDGNIAVEAVTGDATLETVSAGMGSVWVSAVDIVDGDTAGDSEADLSGSVILLTATGAIGAAGNALETSAASLNAHAGGDVFLAEADALVVDNAIASDVHRVQATGASASNMHFGSDGLSGANVVLTTGNGALTTFGAVTANGKLLLQAGGPAGDLTIRSGATAGGALSLEAGRDLVLASSVGSTGSTVDLQAQGALTANEGTAITANANVLLQAGGDVTIDTVNAGIGKVRVVAANLVDGDSGAGETEVDIIADQLLVSATGAVGSASNPLETRVATLAAQAGGLVNIAEADSLLVGPASFGGVSRVNADGSLTVWGPASQGNVIAGGALTLTVAGTLDLAANASLQAAGNLVATADGNVTMAAGSSMQATGPSTIDLTSNTGTVMMDPNTSSLATGSGDIHVTAEGDIQPGAVITQGKAYLNSLNGRVLIRGDLQRNGEDVDLFGNDLVIEVPVSSPGGTLRIGPLNPGTDIVIGDTVPTGAALQVDTGELALLQDGFAQIVIGSSLDHTAILLDGATSPLVFHDPLVLTATGAGGTVKLQGSVTGDSLTIADAGDHTTLATATVAMQGSVLVQDQLTVDGPNTITGSGSLHFTQAVTGAGGAADTLALDAGGGSVAMDQPVTNLDGLSISNASDVHFGAAVTLSGDLVIDATGTVTFDGPLTLTNGARLIVRGGGQVVFNDSADLGSGDALLQVSGIHATGGTGSLRGTGALQVQGATATQAIHVGAGTAAAGELVVGNDVLGAVGAGFTALHIGTGTAALTLGDADLSATGAPVELQGSSIAMVATGAGVRLGTSLALHATGDITAAGQLQATTAANVTLTSDTGAITMAAGSKLASQGGHIALTGAGNLAVAGLDARSSTGTGTVSLSSATGAITDADADSAINVYAQGVDFHGRGTQAGSAQVLEVAAAVVRVDPAGGIVLRDSGTDGRVYYNVLHGSDLEQALVAVGASQRVTTDPDAFVAGGGLQQLAAASTGVRTNSLATALSLSLGSYSAPSGNTQVQSYLASTGTTADAGLTLSQRLQAESELSFASGQPAGDATGVDYWTESLSV